MGKWWRNLVPDGVGTTGETPTRKAVFETRYLSNDSHPRGSWAFMQYFSAAVLLFLYFFFAAVFIFLLVGFIYNSAGDFLPMAFAGLVFIVFNALMVDFPLRFVSIHVAEYEIIFKAQDSGFMFFGPRVQYSLKELLGLTISSSQGYFIFTQEGKREHILNVKGLNREHLDSLLNILKKNPNVKMEITK